VTHGSMDVFSESLGELRQLLFMFQIMSVLFGRHIFKKEVALNP
jgi:hypothetical protein